MEDKIDILREVIAARLGERIIFFIDLNGCKGWDLMHSIKYNFFSLCCENIVDADLIADFSEIFNAQKIFLNPEDNVFTSYVYANGKSIVYVHDESIVYARDESIVYANGKSIVYARDESIVYARDKSKVIYN